MMYLRTIIGYLLCSVVLVSSCTDHKKVKSGSWHAWVTTQGQKIPFTMQISREGSYRVNLINGEETIVIDSVRVEGDSLIIPMHIFDASLIAKANEEHLEGFWIKHYLDGYKLPFEATFGGNTRFGLSSGPRVELKPKYRVDFYANGDTTQAIGLFEQHAGRLTGTFLTSTGDYRFLEGVVDGDSLHLSTFNGASAYLFKARVRDNDEIEGEFYSGKSGYKKWSAVPDPDFDLVNPDSITTLKPGNERFSFALPDAAGDTLRSSDPLFENKVTIVQVLGSWCPNCMDETAFLVDWIKKNQSLPVQVVGLAFEQKGDFPYGRARIKKMNEKYQINYPILFAGSTKKENIQEKLPILDKLNAFPSTIFVDRLGKIKKIHTGFAGPGTGEYYEEFKIKFDSFVNELTLN